MGMAEETPQAAGRDVARERAETRGHQTSATSGEVEIGAPARSRGTDAGFLPSRPARLGSESVLVRLIATLGVVAIGTVVGAILVQNSVAGWITGLVVAAVSVVLAGVLWRSRSL